MTIAVIPSGLGAAHALVLLRGGVRATVVAQHADRAQPLRQRRAARVSVRAPGLLSYEAYRRALTPVVRARLPRRGARAGERAAARAGSSSPANHDSMLDPFVLAAAIPRPMRYLAKAELWRVPGLRWWLGTVEAIPVHRGRSDIVAIERRDRRRSRRARSSASSRRAACGREGPWLRGAARMALATGAPLLPVRLLGTRKALGRGRIAFPPLAALIGEPIAVERTEPTGGARAGADRPAPGGGRGARHLSRAHRAPHPASSRRAAGTLGRCQVAASEQTPAEPPRASGRPRCAEGEPAPHLPALPLVPAAARRRLHADHLLGRARRDPGLPARRRPRHGASRRTTCAC